jgi:formylglycine-generating enzyme required for sulfatase activity
VRLLITALAIALLVSILPASIGAQTGSGILDIWLKVRESADAPNDKKITLYTKSKALVIGMDHYSGGWPQLSNGIKDAEEVAKGLAAQGFEVTFKKDLKSRDLDDTLRDFFIVDGDDPNARLLLWFAGHGDTIDGEAYLVPTDAPSPKADAEFRLKAISLRRFGEYMREAKARHVLAVFDSCFSGGVFNVARSAPPPAITFATTQPVREFISSGEAEQQVSDDGTFRKLFLDALAGKEPDADANHDGYVTGTELGLFLQQKMTNLTNNRQTPRYGKLNAYGYDRGDFVFQVGKLDVPTTPAPSVTQPTNEAAQAWAATQGTTSQAVLESFIRRYGDSFYADLARARLEELKKSQVAVVTQPAQVDEKPVVQHILGMQLAEMSDELRQRYNIKKDISGVVITGVDPSSVAADKRLSAGDVIFEVAYQAVSNPADLQKRIDKLRKAGRRIALLLVVSPNGERPFVPLPLDELKEGQVAVVAPPTAPAVSSGPCGSAPISVSLSSRPAKPLPAAEECALKPKDVFKECDKCPEMIVVPSGSFTMGSPSNEPERYDDEAQVRVTIPKPFAVGQYAVTFDEWDACVADGGCGGYRPFDNGWGRGRQPVINVSWDDAQKYVSWISSKTGKTYRLLSEAEREYVTRAGTTTPFWWGNSITPKQANYDGTYAYNGGSKGENREQTMAVDSFAPNPWGVYNVHGNVWEWTQDCYDKDNSSNPGDGSARTRGDCSRRVLRGGSWRYGPTYLRAAIRGSSDLPMDHIGFRVARTLTP